MNFNFLTNVISTHADFQQDAVKAINVYLTTRNWLIGFYIVEFEQKGEDRAKYGDKILSILAKSLNINGLGSRNLSLYRQFYFEYPSIVQTVSAQLRDMRTKIQLEDNHILKHPVFNQLITDEVRDLGNRSSRIIKPQILISNLSFSHFALLMAIKEQDKRQFYENETINGAWSINELKRQINTLYYERSDRSKRPDQLKAVVNDQAERINFAQLIKSPFTFEFLGLKSKDAVYENDLEQALIDNLEGFLLELGHGFCFEAKQKRIIIGDEYYFVDLVFYHRILKCHVLIELKTDEIKHEYIGQLKTYINYYKKEMMRSGDNPPVGILLVTKNKQALVEYAMADSDAQLFVRKYILELPSKQQLEDFMSNELTQF